MRKLCNIILFLLLFIGQAMASEYRWTTVLNGKVVAGNVLDLADPLAILEPGRNVSYKWAVLSNYTRENKTDVGVSSASPSPWSYTINYTISYLNEFGTLMKSENNTLTINYSASGKSAYTDARIHTDAVVSPAKPNARAKVTVTSVATSGTVPAGDLRLELTLIAEETQQMPSASNAPDAFLLDNNNLVAWNYIKGAVEYEVEWVAVDYYANTTNVTDFFSFKEPVRVTTSQQFYIPNFIYPNAMVYLRVRGVSYYPNGTPNYTAWSTMQTINMRGASNVGIEESRNWQMTTTFAEEGKNKKLISYMDGTARTRQTTTNLNSEAIVTVAAQSLSLQPFLLASETKYDFEGRPSVQVLPTPIKNTTFKSGYIQNLNVFTTAQGKKSYDAEVTINNATNSFNSNNGTEALAISVGASKYYSPSNDVETFMKDYIPNANGYPFTQIRYAADPTGRLVAQSGVGEPFHLKPGTTKKFTRYFYGSANDNELKRLFGTNLGTSTHYSKNMVVDPNGQISISYLDQYDRVVATALAGASPTNVQTLASNVPSAAPIPVSIINGGSQGSNIVDRQAGTSKSVTTILNVTGNSEYVFNYDLVGMRNNLTGACLDCNYTLTVTITSPDGSVVNINDATTQLSSSSFTRNIVAPSSTLCNKYDVSASFSAIFTDIGDYTVTKELKLVAGDITTITNQLSTLTEFPKFEEYLKTETDLIDESQCDITCEQKCMTAVLNSNTLWKANPELYASDIQVDYQNRIGTFCSEIIQGTFVKSAEAECNSLLLQMKRQVTPDQTGDATKIGYLFNKTAWLNYVLAQPQNKDWGLGGSSGSYTLPSLTNLQEVSNYASGKTFGPNNISWADVLVTYHPEYCHYQACITNKDSKTYDKNMVMATNWDNGITTGYIDPLDMNDASIAIPAVTSPNVNTDPFFKTGGYGAAYISDARDMVTNYYREDETQYEDFDNNGVFNDVFSIWEFSSSPYTYQNEVTGNPRNPTSEEKWKTLTSLYQGIKQKIEHKIKTDNHCGDRTQSPGTFLDPLKLVVADFPDTPETKEDAEAINNGHLASSYSSQCSGNVAQWVTQLTNATGTLKDGLGNPIHCLNSTIDITSATNILQSYCALNCNIANPFGYIFKEDLSPTVASGLEPLQTILTNNGCSITNTDNFASPVYKSTYVCSGKYVVVPTNLLPTNASNFLVDVTPSPTPEFNPSITSIQNTGSFISNNEMFFDINRLPNLGIYIPSYGRIWHETKLDLRNPFTISFQMKNKKENQPFNGFDSYTYFTLYNGTASTLLNTDYLPYYTGIPGVWPNFVAVFAKNPTFSAGFRHAGSRPPANLIFDNFNVNLFYNDNSVFGSGFNSSGLLPHNDDIYNNIKITWSGFPSNTYKVYVNNMSNPVLNKNVDLTSSSYLGANEVYWGFEMNQHGGQSSKIRNVVMSLGPEITACVPKSTIDPECPDVSKMYTPCTYNLANAINAYTLQKRGLSGTSFRGPHINCLIPPSSPPALNTVYLNDADGKYRYYYQTEASCVTSCTSGMETMVLTQNSNNFSLNLSSNDYACGQPFGSCIMPPLNPVTISIKVNGVEINPNDLISISQPYSTSIGACPNRNIAFVDVTYKLGNKIIVALGTLEQYHGVSGNSSTIQNEMIFAPFPDCNKFAIVQANVTKATPCLGKTATANFVVQALGNKLVNSQAYRPDLFTYNVQYNGVNILQTPVGWSSQGTLQATFERLAFEVQQVFDIVITVTTLTPGNGTTIKPTYGFYVEGASDITGSRFNGKEIRLVTTKSDGSLVVLGTAILSGGQDAGDCCGNAKTTYTINWDTEKQKCLAFQRSVAETNATQKWTEAKNTFISNYLSANYNNCFNTHFRETFGYTYTNQEYHYTLYYYDQAGNLVQTVPPAGVNPLPDTDFPDGVYNGSDPNHVMRTTYQYNSLNQLIKTNSPDGGTTKYWYDQYGRLRLSQNAKQAAAAANTYSYTNYDEHNRIIEVGETKLSNSPIDLDNPTTMYALVGDNNFSVANREYVTYTVYDKLDGYPLENLRNRVAKSYAVAAGTGTPDAMTMYSYDAHGNVKKIWQNVTGLGEKTIDYNYELVSGLVKQVDYQKGAEDQFSHNYQYDQDGRLRNVFTSLNGTLWEEDATYFFHKHGPLARTEIGHDKVQGLDYFYTSQGWLKGINLPNARAPLSVANPLNQFRNTLDPGSDGKIFGGSHAMNAQDEYSLSLGYHENDYTPIGGVYEPYSQLGVNLGLSANATVWSGNTFLGSPNVNPMYNGNIAFTVQQMPGVTAGTLDATNPVQAMGYRYDQLNRLVQGRSFVTSTDGGGVNTWVTRSGNSNETNKFDFGYTYDPNGNIKSAKVLNQTGGIHLDLTYNYAITPVNNQLTSVSPANGSTSTHPLMATSPASAYGYDEIGNLKSDASEKIETITWSPYGKILTVTRGTGSTAPNLEFKYNAQGQRISKTVIPKGINPVTATTYYIHDASGHVVAQYDITNNPTATASNNIEIEYPIYGSSRIGLYKKVLKADYAAAKSNAKESDNNLLAGSNFIVNIPTGPRGGAPFYQLNLTKVLPTAYDQGSGKYVLQPQSSPAMRDMSQINLSQQEDDAGNLLFYASAMAEAGSNDALFVADKTGSVMPNSYGMFSDNATESVIVKSPGKNARHIIVTRGRDGKLYMHFVDMDLQGNAPTGSKYGDIIYKNILLSTNATHGNKLIALESAGGGYSVIYTTRYTPPSIVGNLGTLSLVAYKINTAQPGTQTPQVVASFPSLDNGNGQSEIQLSPDGKSIYVLNHTLQNGFFADQQTQLLSFDLDGGYNIISSTPTRSVDLPLYSNAGQSIEFSKDGRYVFIGQTGSAQANNTTGSENSIYVYDLKNPNNAPTLLTMGIVGNIRRGVDDRIYATNALTNQLVAYNTSSGTIVAETNANVALGNTPNGSLPLRNFRVFDAPSAVVYTRQMGNKLYELSDHLGNVHVVVTDQKIGVAYTSTTAADYYIATIASAQDYYPFGEVKPGTSYNTPDYRYGFNGKETQSELNEDVYDFGPRMHNAALGRFMSVDKLTSVFASFSPYLFAANSPIIFKEDGNKFVFANDPTGQLEKDFNEALGKLEGTEVGEFLLFVKNDNDIEVNIELPDNMDNHWVGAEMTMYWDPYACVKYSAGFYASSLVTLAHEARHLFQYLTGNTGPNQIGSIVYPPGHERARFKSPNEDDAMHTWELEIYNKVSKKKLNVLRETYYDQLLIMQANSKFSTDWIKGDDGKAKSWEYDPNVKKGDQKITYGGYQLNSRYEQYYGTSKVGNSKKPGQPKTTTKEKYKKKYVKDAAGNKVSTGAK